ncbi:hypothetical protein [Sphingosinicella terrae]|uniref:hypothetical protein n=1 Tax=Sphingosinicella terrae TaxID=2172047 RepID=UPI0013B3D67D|nr:hypothetical protein [Sphingosinicella terrae]
MVQPYGFKPADLGGEPADVICSPAYRPISIEWAAPEPWGASDVEAPIARAQQKPGYLYAISWDHHLATKRETIAYIGITDRLDRRFDNHPTAAELRGRKRKTFLSIGHVDFGRLKNTSRVTRRITEELEHILIWALWKDLVNDRKMMCIPGFGTNGGGAWHITNTGHSFSGRMPREIIFPWMLIKPRRDRPRI